MKRSCLITMILVLLLLCSRVILAQSWTSATTSADWQPRFQHSSVVFENKMWILGGENNGELLNDVWYSSDGKNWQQACSKAGWSGRACLTSVVFKGKIWIIGGAEAKGKNLNDVWYSTDGNVWNLAASSSEWAARKSFSALDYKNRIWIIGGDTTAYKFGTNDVWNFK